MTQDPIKKKLSEIDDKVSMMNRRKKNVLLVVMFSIVVLLFLLLRMPLYYYFRQPSHTLLENILLWGIVSVLVIVAVGLRRYLYQPTMLVEDEKKKESEK